MKQIAATVLLILVSFMLVNGQDKKKSVTISNEDFPTATGPDKSPPPTEKELPPPGKVQPLADEDLDILVRSANPVAYQDLKSKKMRGLKLHFQYYDLLLASEKVKSASNYGSMMARIQNEILSAPYEKVTDQDLIDLVYRDKFTVIRAILASCHNVLDRAQSDLAEARTGRDQKLITETEERVKQAELGIKRVEAQTADLLREGREKGASDRAFKLIEQ